MANQQQQEEEATITIKQIVTSESYRLRHDNGRWVCECFYCQRRPRPRRRKRIRQTMLSAGVINVWTVIIVVLQLLCTHFHRIEYYVARHDDGVFVVSAAPLEISKRSHDDSDLSSSSSMQQHSTTIMGEGEKDVDIKEKTHEVITEDITNTIELPSDRGNNKDRSSTIEEDDDENHETRRRSSSGGTLEENKLLNQEKKDNDSFDDASQSSTPTPSSTSTPLVLDTDKDDTTSSKPTTASSSEEEQNNQSSSCSASSATSLSSPSEEQTCQSNEVASDRTTGTKSYGSLSKDVDKKIADLEENEDTISRTIMTTTTTNSKQDECNDVPSTDNEVPAFLEEAKKLLKISQRQQQQKLATPQESVFDYASHLEQCHLYSMILHHHTIGSDYYNWCQSYEMTRLMSNEDALRRTSSDDVAIITRSSLPSDLVARLREFYDHNSSIGTTTLWSEGEAIVYTNPWNSVEAPQSIQLSNDETQILKDDLLDSIEAMWMEKVVDSNPIVSFAKHDIEIRTLSRGAVISPHTTTTFVSSNPNHSLGVAIVVLDIVVDEKDHNGKNNNKNENTNTHSSPQPSWIWELHSKNKNNTCHEDDHAGTSSSTVPTLSSFSLQAGDILFIENANHVVMGAPYPLLHENLVYMELYFTINRDSTTNKQDASKTTTRQKTNVKRDYLKARRQRQQSKHKSLEETASSVSSITSTTSASSTSLVASQSDVDAVPPTSQFLSSTSTTTIPHYLTSPIERTLWHISRPTETKVSIQQVLKTSGTSFLSKKGMTIHRAAALGDVTQMQLLVEKYGSSILQKKDSNGWQPLHEAARSGEVEAIQFLLDHKVEVNVRTNRGKGGNALYWAAKANGVHHPSVKLLEDHGAILQKPLVRIV